MLTRRRLIETGAIGGALLSVAGTLSPAAWSQSAVNFRALDGATRSALMAIADVVLDGALPVEPTARAKAIDTTILAVDGMVADMPGAIREELAQLFGLLTFWPARRFIVGLPVDWPQASREQVSAFMGRWRDSSFLLLVTAYVALKQLVGAAYYGDPANFARTGYPGPPDIG